MAEDEAKDIPVVEDDADARRAEVKARMAKETALTKKKKGFMTPARKSKLRMLLRKKAAEELKKEEAKRKEERRRIVGERCGKEKPIENIPDDGLRTIVQEYYNHILACEDAKYDLEMKLMVNDFTIVDLTNKVTDLRGRFVKPTLKKVAKFEDKFAQLNKKAAEFKFKSELDQTL
ncbi:unnamed protein product [Meganyctiphanes norvegica]|uniref:Troponin I n=1 Tax=Meganyctiphanes norvegica TaxID=48144 RepID=A0AAV2Q626_MEGNR